ncbi:MAG: hypothetical protein GWN58_33510 [Anaerolineae bacterium]|nr:hypothetical protein [Thermoplasmata archaeon]NIV34195.1 hypothetical protein [Anaerolineae bacterium]NIY06044.1 hypothetical protein [Thermoplasmata archaeon]
MKLKIKDGKAKLAAKFTTGDELAKAIEAAIRKHFPKSHLKVWVSKGGIGGTTIDLDFAVAGSKSEVANGIWHNDISLTRAVIYGLDADGNLKERLEFHPAMGGSITTKPTEKHMAQGRLKVGLRKKKGTPEQVLKHIDTYFKKLHKAIVDNADKLQDEDKKLLKSIKL